MKRAAVSLLSGLVVVAVGHRVPVFGQSAELDSLMAAIARSSPEAERDAIRDVLRRRDCTYISGRSVEEVKHFEKKIQLNYKSDTGALAKFLDDLARSSSSTVWVRFYKSGRNASWAPADSNWSVFYSPFANCFTVWIRLDSDIDLTELYIPPLRAERRDE